MSLNGHLLVNFVYFSLSPILKVVKWRCTNTSITSIRGEYTCKVGKITIYHKGNSIREVKLCEGAETSTGNGWGVGQGAGPTPTTSGPPSHWLEPSRTAPTVFTILPALLGPSPLALYQSAYMLSASSLSPVQRLEEAGLFSPGTPPLPSSGMLATEGLHQAPTPTVEPQQPIDPEKSDQEWKEMLCSITMKMLTQESKTARTP